MFCGVEGPARKGVGHGHDAVQGRADLVTHIGQELGLGPVCILRAAAGEAEVAGHPPLAVQEGGGAEKEDHADADDPALALNDVGLKLGVGAGRLQLLSALVQLVPHPRSDLADAVAEAARLLKAFFFRMAAKQVEGFTRTALGVEKFGLCMQDL